MSDTPVDGWWQANNGRWYPPETHPSFTPEGPIAPPEGWVIGADGEWGPPADEAGPAVAGPTEAGPPESGPIVIPPSSADLDPPDLSLLPPIAPVRPAVAAGDVDVRRRWPTIAVAGVGAAMVLLGVGTLVITVQDNESPVKVGSVTTIREIAPETTAATSTTTVPEPTVPETTAVAPPG